MEHAGTGGVRTRWTSEHHPAAVGAVVFDHRRLKGREHFRGAEFRTGRSPAVERNAGERNQRDLPIAPSARRNIGDCRRAADPRAVVRGGNRDTGRRGDAIAGVVDP